MRLGSGVSLIIPLVVVDHKMLIVPSEKITPKAIEPRSETPPALIFFDFLRVTYGVYGLPYGLLEKAPNVYAGPYGSRVFTPKLEPP